ncbi:MAG TPA: sigma-70 family RNA polymerase sigma factor [Candidatus Angelobacter sp.]|nr:sigma-70 family RNA polymerase sigma factor [Candidatus Angelobacter sp.]
MTTARPASPGELALRIQSGERAAEAELVERYSRGIMIIVRRIARDSSLTDDLCQETFRLVLLKVRRGDLKEPDKLSGFICSVARNLAIDHMRSVRPTEDLAGMNETDALEHPAPDALDRLLREEKVRAVQRVLAELTTGRDREILQRFYVAEEEKEVICTDLGLSSLHFNRVLYRARERFRELYERER